MNRPGSAGLRWSGVKRIFYFVFLSSILLYVTYLLYYAILAEESVEDHTPLIRNHGFLEGFEDEEPNPKPEVGKPEVNVENEEDDDEIKEQPEDDEIKDDGDPPKINPSEEDEEEVEEDEKIKKQPEEEEDKDQSGVNLKLPTQNVHEVGERDQKSHERLEEKQIHETAPWEFSIHDGIQTCEPDEKPRVVMLYFESFHNTIVLAKREGKTMGELRYWKDVFTGLTTLCLDIIFVTDENDKRLKNYDCSNVDVIISDQYNFKKLPIVLFPGCKCKLRLLDVWGTPKKQNHENLHSKQYLVPFEFMTGVDPNFQNAFIGTILPDPDYSVVKINQGLLWGKQNEYFSPYLDLIEKISKIVPLKSTAKSDVKFKKGNNVENLGIVTQERRTSLLRESKFIIGFGHPVLGLTPFEALAHGCIVLIPVYDKVEKTWNNPTIPITSQHPEAEKIGEPYVYNVKLDNHQMILDIVEKIVNEGKHLTKGYRQDTYKVENFLERLKENVYKEFC